MRRLGEVLKKLVRYWRWSEIIYGETILSRVRNILSEYDKRLYSIILFGSRVYNPYRARDIDIIIIIDNLPSINGKINIELMIKKTLSKFIRKPLDVHIFDLDTFVENLKPGTFLCGLALGYKIIYDEIGIDKYIKRLFKEMSRHEDYILYRGGKKYMLGLMASIKSK